MPDQAVRPGAQRLAKLDNEDLPGVVRVHAADCVSQTVKTGCTIILQAAARWTYIYVNSMNKCAKIPQKASGNVHLTRSSHNVCFLTKIDFKKEFLRFWEVLEGSGRSGALTIMCSTFFKNARRGAEL